MGGISKLPRPFKEWTTYKNHVGIDYPYADDILVKASGNGRITYSGYYSMLGGYGVTVQYDNGQEHKYKHSDALDWRASVGARVKLGDNLMEIGGLGLGSTGPHLHHEVFINGVIHYGDNYWKYVDKSESGYVGASDGASNGGNNFYTPTEENLMILEALSNSEDGLVKQGRFYADDFTSPITLISQDEIDAIKYWEDRGIPYRLARWDGAKIRSLISTRGLQPHTNSTGQTLYDKQVIY